MEEYKCRPGVMRKCRYREGCDGTYSPGGDCEKDNLTYCPPYQTDGEGIRIGVWFRTDEVPPPEGAAVLVWAEWNYQETWLKAVLCLDRIWRTIPSMMPLTGKVTHWMCGPTPPGEVEWPPEPKLEIRDEKM